MRRKAWTEPEIDKCPFYAELPSTRRGLWQTLFRKKQPLWLEIGCGKGISTAHMAHDNPDCNLIAVDEVRTVLAVAIRNTYLEYGDDPVDNLVYSEVDAERIYDSFMREDGVERIYINFCNPWDEKAKHHKRRLTHPRQLMQYRDFLQTGGKIYFKTDNDALFQSSIRYLETCCFKIIYQTNDLHASGYTPNYVSEHEKLYVGRGERINFLIAEMMPWDGREVNLRMS